jgi:hypothetical protein
VKRSHFRAAFESNEQLELVLSWLTTTGKLLLSESGANRQIVKQQHTWPDGERRRSYVIGHSRLSVT